MIVSLEPAQSHRALQVLTQILFLSLSLSILQPLCAYIGHATQSTSSDTALIVFNAKFQLMLLV